MHFLLKHAGAIGSSAKTCPLSPSRRTTIVESDFVSPGDIAVGEQPAAYLPCNFPAFHNAVRTAGVIREASYPAGVSSIDNFTAILLHPVGSIREQQFLSKNNGTAQSHQNAEHISQSKSAYPAFSHRIRFFGQNLADVLRYEFTLRDMVGREEGHSFSVHRSKPQRNVGTLLQMLISAPCTRGTVS